MSDFSDTLESLIPLVGNAAIAKAQEELDTLSADADDPTKALVLALMADAVENLGRRASRSRSVRSTNCFAVRHRRSTGPVPESPVML